MQKRPQDIIAGAGASELGIQFCRSHRSKRLSNVSQLEEPR